MGKRKQKDGLESKVLKAGAFIRRDDEGHYYIPMCNFRHHIGVIEDENPCISRSCERYDRYYLKYQNVDYLTKEEIDSIKCENK